jgi:hypothetical protein
MIVPILYLFLPLGLAVSIIASSSIRRKPPITAIKVGIQAFVGATKIPLPAASYPTAPWRLCGSASTFLRASSLRRGPSHLSSRRTAQVFRLVHVALRLLGLVLRPCNDASLSSQARR